MVRDPLYRAIEERLAGRLDPEMFERCAVDLLREVYPGLVPLRGGDDGGMDGAIADSRGGVPMPLVVTTAGSVIGNLNQNLESYRRGGGTASEAVVATSQPLTARQRRNLEKRAGEFGIALRQIHDQADFVGRLYRSPAWRRELLGLVGDPPALSVLPRSPRPWTTPPELAGRDDELNWLQNAESDVVISGQPGVGKTALLERLAKEGEGLFVVSRDIRRIADAYREQEPRRVFVDDAHLDAVHPHDSLLGKLSRLRQELDMRFQIMATTWTGHEDDVRQRLFLSREYILPVGALERAAMTEIIRGVDPQFTARLIREILDQSEGRPGLAVTLAQWAQRGELTDLLSGRLLLSEIKKDLPSPDRTLDALAPFALADKYGMRLPAAAEALRWPESELRQALRPVSGAGILREADDRELHNRLVRVEPEALRVALVERAYFGSGALVMPVEPALRQVDDPHAGTHTLIQVLRRGGRVPHRLIQTRLEELHRFSWPGDLWERYVWTGEEAARWVLERHPDRVVSVGGAALEVVPDSALDALLTASSEGNPGTDDPTPIIENWVRSGLPGKDAVERRIALIERLAVHIRSAHEEQKSWCSSGRLNPTDLLCAAFSLSTSAWRWDPLDDRKVTVTSGSLRRTEIKDLARMWPAALDALGPLGDSGIRCARRIVEEWTGNHLKYGHHPATRQAIEQEAPRMLQDVVALASRAPGIVMWARRQARDGKLEADLPQLNDPLLDKLFPDTEYPWEDSFPTEVIRATVSEFVEEWRREDPEAVARRMMEYERQRKLAGHIYPDALGQVPDALAQRVAEPLKWLRAFVDLKAPASWVQPLLEAAVTVAPASDAPWRIVAPEATYDLLCTRLAPNLPRLSETAVGHVLEAVRRVVAIRHDLVPWSDLSRTWQRRLLRDRDPRVRAATAAALWQVHRGELPGGALGMLLRDGIVESSDPSLLQDLLSRDPQMARAWVLQEARDSPTWRSRRETRAQAEEVEHSSGDRNMQSDLSPQRYSELLETASKALTIEDRRDLILAIPAHADQRFFGHLVGTDPHLYRVLLERNVPATVHLEPLCQEHSEELETLIRMAREQGYPIPGDC